MPENTIKVINTEIEGVMVIEPRMFSDNRGVFFESYNKDRYCSDVIDAEFVQDNVSISKKNVLRGLHYQLKHPQGKLVSVLEGEVFDVAVDIRVGSPTFGQWTGIILSAENRRQFYIPENFAHGFCVLSNTAIFQYKCTAAYQPGDEYTLIYSDPDIGINWPCDKPLLSDKDKIGLSISELDDHLPIYQG